MPQYNSLVDQTIKTVKENNPESSIDDLALIAMDNLAVNFGCEILKIIPGRVSTEVPPAYSYDTEKTLRKH